MISFARRLESARQHVVPRWTALREKEAHGRVQHALRRRVWSRYVSFAVLGVMVFAVAYTAWSPSSKVSMAETSVAEQRAQGSDRTTALLRLADGSRATAMSTDAALETVEAGAKGVLVRLRAGMARFEVTSSPERQFLVDAGGVRITVVGTIFVVGIANNGVVVRVERGSVRVESATETRLLRAGDSTLVQQPEPKPGDAGPGSTPPMAPATASKATSWRLLAQDRDYKAAYQRLLEAGSKAVRDEPNDLLLAADTARLSGHPEQAITYLRRVLENHASDARAPLAAFTLGRVLLDQSGRPRQAAEAFALARRSAPEGPLADYALAREVESWARAGDAARSRQRALQYLRLFPRGPHASFVRRHAGLD